MAGFEDVRGLNGMRAPLHDRLEFRQTFERWFSYARQQRPLPRDAVIGEQEVLGLCKHFRLSFVGGDEGIAKSWNESEERRADGGPTFEELHSLGWVVFDGGRWLMPDAPRGCRFYINFPTPSTEKFLNSLSKLQLTPRTESPPTHLQEIASSITTATMLDRHIPTRDPDWLAARLWEQLCLESINSDDEEGSESQTALAVDEINSCKQPPPEQATIDSAFLEWSAWCAALQSSYKWANEWSATEMERCREAACRVLNRQKLWGVWDVDISRYSELLEKTYAIPERELRYGYRPRKKPPQSLIFRAEWLRSSEVEQFMMERLGASSVSFAFGLLCSELERTEIGPEIKNTVDKTLSFAFDYPMALQKLIFRIEAAPALLVDMLMHPRTACLAARIAIEWPRALLAEGDRNISREAKIREFALQDTLSFLAHHLERDELDLEECASLVTWCFAQDCDRRVAGASSRKPFGEKLLSLISKRSDSFQCEVLAHLVGLASYENNIPRARFTGVLSGLNKLSNDNAVDPLPVVELYSKFARDQKLDWTDASSLPANLAARLVASALSQADSVRHDLLVPFDSAKLIKEMPVDEKPFLLSNMAQTLRTHICLLARAIDGWSEKTIPSVLVDAFQLMISRSVIEHAEKGRIGAITDRYSTNSLIISEVRSPAQDLTAAWKRLDGHQQEALLQALAQSDDPVLLAELCQQLPASAKSCIKARLRQLKPREASELWTWPELQHRIASFLAAGEYDLAREHLDDDEVDKERAPAQFRLGLFGLELQLLIKERNWIALDSAVIPSDLDVPNARQAQDQLDFYKATSQLLRESGNLAGARSVLQRLSTSPGAASAYRENAFAVAIQQLLGQTLQPLTGADKATGERLHEEINNAIANTKDAPSSSLLANRALLLLALQQPENALESIAPYRKERKSSDLELVTVIAKSELGLKAEAMAILDAAIEQFDGDKRLHDLKNDLQAGINAHTVASASETIDPISSIRAALHQLIELPPSMIGEVFAPPDRGVRNYLIKQVSLSVASLQHMSAMLRARKDQTNDAKLEDDLNTAVRELLGARLAVIKWDVADQSLGGTTLNGNPGERDAVIRASGQEISVYEALVCSRLDRRSIKEHFYKLLSYGVCDIYFHVTYAYTKPKPILDYIRQLFDADFPPNYVYLGCKALTPPDCELSGYVANYRIDHREVAVVFFVVELQA